MPHSTPVSGRRGRPASAKQLRNIPRSSASSLRRRPLTAGTTNDAKLKVQTQLSNLQNTSIQLSSKQASIKQKLDNFANTFCKSECLLIDIEVLCVNFHIYFQFSYSIKGIDLTNLIFG